MPVSQNQSKPTHVVAIGASAGGLEAIGSVFESMPGDTGMAFVVIQHLSPDFNSLMDEILVRYTKMAIHKVEEGMSVEENSVYLIPAKKQMIIKGDKFHLTEREKANTPEALITQFFESLAKEWGEKSIGIVLSGTGSDGSTGITEIHKAGGLTLVQEPSTAKFDGMPKSAIATGLVDLVMETGQFVNAILKFRESPQEARKMDGHLPPDAEVDNLKRVYQLLNEHGGIDFEEYKPSTINRRIDRRISMVGVDDLPAYRRILERDAAEIDLLFQDLLIGVTEFFRDRESFEELPDLAFPGIFDLVENDRELRIWVAGCATGEEVYTLAILLDEYCEKNDVTIRWKIFATDVHRRSLSIANLGEYARESLQNVSEERLEKYFVPSGQAYRVSRSLREQIVFANHNLLEDAPFAKIHLVSCRNLLIYFKPAAQKKALQYFRFALVHRGVLFLGNSETPGEVVNDFEKLSDKAVLFRKIQESGRALTNISYPPINRQKVEKSVISESQFPERLFTLVLDQILPGGILINSLGEIVYSAGDIREFMRPPSGRMVNIALEMLPEGLQMHLSGGIQQAKRQKKEIVYHAVPITHNGEEIVVGIRINPIFDELSALEYTFVSISRNRHHEDVEVETINPADVDKFTLMRIKELENDLRLSQEGLQNVVEELETSNEELQATNEELIASNEELQSTNEELQSVNEELYTVNSEYDTKNRQLADVNADLDNLLKSTQVGVVFLDEELRIRKFTPAAGAALNLLKSDIGRPLEHLANTLDPADLDLLSEVRRVEQGGRPFETEVTNKGGEYFLLRLLPFLDSGDKPCGVVITLFDINLLKELESQKDETMTRFKLMVDSSENITWFNLDQRGHFGNSQKQWEGFTGQSWPDYEDHGWMRAFHPEDRKEIREICQEAFGHGKDFEFRKVRIFSHRVNDYRYCRVALCSHVEGGKHNGWLGYVFDEHDVHAAMERLGEQTSLLSGVIENAPLGVAVKDLEGRYVLANEHMAEILSELDSEKLIGKTISDFLTSRLAAPIIENDKLILGSGEKKVFNEVMGIGALTRVFEVTRFPLLGKDGEIAGLVCLASDLTDREREIKLRAQTEELSRVNNELARKNQELDDFAHVISHDLKQPLRTMTAFGEVLTEEIGDDLGEEEKDALYRIRRSGEQMREMIDAILDYSRSARAVANPTDISLSETMDLVLESLETEIKESGATFHVAKNLPSIRADKMLIYRIVMNLVTNALKFNDAEKPQIWITGQKQDEYTFIGIEDNGIGVPQEYSKMIFKPFERLHTKGDYAGHGIGLAIADRLVDAQGGEIWCEGRSSGSGSRFIFTIPNT